MNFALLGDTPGLAVVLEAISQDPDHDLTCAVVPDESSLLLRHPSAKRVARWEDLLTARNLDAVIISGNDDDVLPPARQLASTGRPIVVVPSRGMTSAFVYELSLVRDENRVALFPVMPHRHDPALLRLCEIIQSGEIGTVIQMSMERSVPARDGVLGRDRDVEPWLLMDGDLLLHAAGTFTQVTAMYQGRSETGFAIATVTLAGDQAIDTTWALSIGNEPGWKLSVSGTGGSLLLSEDAAGQVRLLRNESPVQFANGRDFSDQTDRSKSLARALTRLDSEASPRIFDAWTSFTRSFEIVDAHRRSVSRRRTIDMHFETMSERGQFKTQMSAIGCGVLTYTLFGLVAYLVVAAAFEPAEDAAQAVQDRFRLMCNIGRVVWLAPLCVFMLLQLLLSITRPAIKPTSADAQHAD